jgi:hypothetical protein
VSCNLTVVDASAPVPSKRQCPARLFCSDGNGTNVAFDLAMKVRLTKKFAEMLDGIDLSARHVGEVFDLPASEARLIVAEQWAQLVDDQTPCSRPQRDVVPHRLPHAS